MVMIAKPFTLLLISFFVALCATSLAVSYEGEILKFPGEAERGGEANPTREREDGAQGRRNPSYWFESYRRFFDRKKINLSPEDCVRCVQAYDLCRAGCKVLGPCTIACRADYIICMADCG